MAHQEALSLALLTGAKDVTLTKVKVSTSVCVYMLNNPP